MGDTIPMNREPRARKGAPARPANAARGERILAMKLPNTPQSGDTVSFTREGDQLLLVHNQRRYRVPTPPACSRQDVIILRWERSECGLSPSFHRGEPLPLCTDTRWVFCEEAGWEELAEAA